MAHVSQGEFVGALGIYAAGGLFWAFLPLFVGLQISDVGLSDWQAGLLGSAYLLGFSVASLSAVWWVVRANWRTLTVLGAALTIACLWVLQGSDVYPVQILSVLLIGVCLGGFWSIAYRVFGAGADPDRSFAIGIVVSYTLLAAVSYVVARHVAPEYGLTGSAFVLSIVIALLAGSAGLLPKAGIPGDSVAVAINFRPPLPVGLALTGLLLTGLAFAAVWAFAERMGVVAGFGESQISPVIAGNLLASAAGSVLASAIGSRFGRAPPLLSGLVLFAACILLLTRTDIFWLYAMAVTGLGFFVGFVLPYQMGAIGAADTGGRFVVLIAAAQGAGSALGTYTGGLAFNAGGARLLSIFAASALVMSALLFVRVLFAGAK